MDPTLTALLLCPNCGEEMEARTDHGRLAGIRCARGHAYDRAKYGYFNLLTGKATSFASDSAEMVESRELFLAGGHYAPLTEALAELAAPLRATNQRTILDAGAGTGYYLQAVLDRAPGARTVAIDLSKFALRRAARRLPDALVLAWNIWRPLPLTADSVDVILNVFAPRNPEEFRRVLAPGGALLVVTPGSRHLAQLHRLGLTLSVDPEKAEQLAASMSPHFHLAGQQELEYPMSLDREQLRSLVLMGPAAHHVDAATLSAELAAMPVQSTVTANFCLSRFLRN